VFFLFAKKTCIFKKKDRGAWLRAKGLLKDKGFQFSAGSYDDDVLKPCGCGARLDPRDFGPRGKIDRSTYVLYVRAGDADGARAALSDAGIDAGIDAGEP
jgi:hypothetical protein